MMAEGRTTKKPLTATSNSDRFAGDRIRVVRGLGSDLFGWNEPLHFHYSKPRRFVKSLRADLPYEPQWVLVG